VDPFAWAPPALSELNAARPSEGSVLSAALRRASAERHDPRPVRASFDNNLTGPPADTRG
jgi:hypothetical protein